MVHDTNAANSSMVGITMSIPCILFVLGSNKNSKMTSMSLGRECEHNEMKELEGKKSREWVECKSPYD